MHLNLKLIGLLCFLMKLNFPYYCHHRLRKQIAANAFINKVFKYNNSVKLLKIIILLNLPLKNVEKKTKNTKTEFILPKNKSINKIKYCIIFELYML